jgi:hypothetical protein
MVKTIYHSDGTQVEVMSDLWNKIVHEGTYERMGVTNPDKPNEKAVKKCISSKQSGLSFREYFFCLS